MDEQDKFTINTTQISLDTEFKEWFSDYSKGVRDMGQEQNARYLESMYEMMEALADTVSKTNAYLKICEIVIESCAPVVQHAVSLLDQHMDADMEFPKEFSDIMEKYVTMMMVRNEYIIEQQENKKHT